MNRDGGDIIDRFTISWLKKDRIGTEENQKEYTAFKKEVDNLIETNPQFDWDQIIKFMYDINSAIWLLEAALKNERDILPNPFYLNDRINKDVLTEIGKDTIMIRNINNFRVRLKNLINKLLNQGFQDAKSNHLSQ